MEVLLSEEAGTIAMVDDVGFRYFTPVDEFKRYLSAEVLSAVIEKMPVPVRQARPLAGGYGPEPPPGGGCSSSRRRPGAPSRPPPLARKGGAFRRRSEPRGRGGPVRVRDDLSKPSALVATRSVLPPACLRRMAETAGGRGGGGERRSGRNRCGPGERPRRVTPGRVSRSLVPLCAVCGILTALEKRSVYLKDMMLTPTMERRKS